MILLTGYLNRHTTPLIQTSSATMLKECIVLYCHSRVTTICTKYIVALPC